MTSHNFYPPPTPGPWVLIEVAIILQGCGARFAGCFAEANKLFPYPGYLGAERIHGR
jgi:hypothetical protein